MRRKMNEHIISLPHNEAVQLLKLSEKKTFKKTFETANEQYLSAQKHILHNYKIKLKEIIFA